MKLHELKNGDKFTLSNEQWQFNRIDGMYAKCEKLSNGAPMLVNINNDVEVLDDQGRH